MKKYVSSLLPDFHYYISGKNPEILLHSGTHGDEYEVIEIVQSAVHRYQKLLPDFVFVPIVSPSAVKLGTRLNKNGRDINRIFFSDSTEVEVQENIKALSDFKFDLMVSFHEDPELDSYYIYDEGFDKNETRQVLSHNRLLKKNGIKLLNGFDDLTDPRLGHEFINGYRKFSFSKDQKSSGMATVWALSEKRAKTTLVPEIPGKASLETKKYIVDTFFQEVLIV